MLWFVAIVGCIIVGVAAVRFWRAWLRPWKDVERLVHDVIKGHLRLAFDQLVDDRISDAVATPSAAKTTAPKSSAASSETNARGKGVS